MKHSWNSKRDGQWINKVCYNCGREEEQFVYFGYKWNEPVIAIIKDIGTLKYCPEAPIRYSSTPFNREWHIKTLYQYHKLGL